MTLPANYQFYALAGNVATRNIRYEIDGATVDLTGYDLTWAFDVRGIAVVASTSNGMITTDAEGAISLTLAEVDTAAWVGRGRHYLVITAPITRTLLEGEVIML